MKEDILRRIVFRLREQWKPLYEDRHFLLPIEKRELHAIESIVDAILLNLDE